MGTEPGALGTTDWKKIGMGAVVAVLGFVTAYVTQTVIPQIDQTNTSGMLAVAGFSVVVNILRKWGTDTK